MVALGVRTGKDYFAIIAACVITLVFIQISTTVNAQRTQKVEFSWNGVGFDVQGNPETICEYCLVVTDSSGRMIPNPIDPSDTHCTARVPGTSTPGGDAGLTFSVTLDLPADRGPLTAVVIAIDCGYNHSDPSNQITITFEDCSIPGDVNGDGQVDISDAIALLSYLFMGGTLECPGSGDVTGDGVVDISDAIKILGNLFGGGGGGQGVKGRPTNLRIVSIK